MKEFRYCSMCGFCKGWYRYKTAVRNRPRLVGYYCCHKNFKNEFKGRKFLAYTRHKLENKIKIHPHWCPIANKKVSERGGKINDKS